MIPRYETELNRYLVPVKIPHEDDVVKVADLVERLRELRSQSLSDTTGDRRFFIEGLLRELGESPFK